jgi:hypothetical protein
MKTKRIVLLLLPFSFILSSAGDATFVVNGGNGSSYGAPKAVAPSESRQLLFEDRVAYQRAIEEVYWCHRIWPKGRPDPKPALDAVMSQATIEQKVQDYLRDSEFLEAEWQQPLTPEQLQAEMDRRRSTPRRPRCCANCLARSATIPLSSPSVWPGRSH